MALYLTLFGELQPSLIMEETLVEVIEMQGFKIMTLEERYGDELEQWVRLEPSIITYDELRYLRVLHFGYDGYIYQGEIIVNEQVAQEVLDIFKELYAIQFPIQKMLVMSCYEGDDELSMQDNNTSGFNFRAVTNSNHYSKHAYGLAIDINPLVNPYIKGDVILPVNGEAYMDRNQHVLGMIHEDDCIVSIFKNYGWTWGGDWSSLKDYQHFQK